MTALLTGEQLAGWIDYSTREPFGFPIKDLQVAMQMALAANAAGANPPVEASVFQLADKLGVDEEEEVADEVLIATLKQLMPKPPPPPRVEE